ncbi:MAG: glycoside hydrolase family 25 protein [Bacteroidales bacterium]|nr:glycoside hydrolase family 25 protein [Bacteroidales bacterium]
MPQWLRSLLTVMIVVVFSTAFYLFFIRPYAFRWHLHLNRAPYYTQLPRGYEVCGIDISHYQGNINWGKVAKNRYTDIPLQFVFIKATDGNDIVDESYFRNMAQARKYGFIVSAYHYYEPQIDPLQQADFFIHTVKLKKGDLPPVLDVEKSGHLVKAVFQNDVKQWLKRVESRYGVKPILYTSYKFKLDYLDDDFFNRYPYWIAHYYVSSIAYKGKWSFWQYTDVGYVPGISGDVDLNVFNGSMDEMVSLLLN